MLEAALATQLKGLLTNVTMPVELVSTLDDLVAWDAALFSGRVLRPASLAEMVRDGDHGYGLGLYVGHAYGQRLLSHGGFLDGFSAIKDSYPDLGLTVVVLGNTETTPAQTLSRRLFLTRSAALGCSLAASPLVTPVTMASASAVCCRVRTPWSPGSSLT